MVYFPQVWTHGGAPCVARVPAEINRPPVWGGRFRFVRRWSGSVWGKFFGPTLGTLNSLGRLIPSPILRGASVGSADGALPHMRTQSRDFARRCWLCALWRALLRSARSFASFASVVLGATGLGGGGRAGLTPSWQTLSRCHGRGMREGNATWPMPTGRPATSKSNAIIFLYFCQAFCVMRANFA